MTKAVGVATCIDEEGFFVTSILYEDGRIIRQYGSETDWVQTKNPDITAKEEGC